jgi:hypothetical protein
MKSAFLLLAAGIAFAAQAQTEPPRSLNKARSEINNGTSPGIVIFKSKPKAEVPASPASATSTTSTPPAASATAQVPAPLGNRIVERLNLGEPPSGQPMSGAKRLNSPDQGIPLPTAATAAAAAASAAGKKP